MTDLINVTVGDGKYTIRQIEPGKWECLRYGEFWPAWSGRQPDNLHTALAIEVDHLMDKVDGLSSDLDSAVEVAYRRGAVDWVRLNYPAHFERLSAGAAAAPSSIGDTAKHFAEWCKNEGVGPSDEVFEPALRLAIGNHVRAATSSAPMLGSSSDVEGLIQFLLARNADRIKIVDDFPNRCGLDLPMNDVDDGEMLEVATLSLEDSGYAPALWRLAVAILKSRRATEESANG